jgi:L-ascorbate metabolism protein UlaG (beta-lactamase superfamily)
MERLIFTGLLLLIAVAYGGSVKDRFEEDIISTAAGDLRITFIGHGTLMFTFQDKVIHVDPVSGMADYRRLPPADLILITHEHSDHLDPEAIAVIRTEDTRILMSRSCAERVDGGTVIGNGESTTIAGFPVETYPAYNLVHKRDDGSPYHPQGVGNGYVITFGNIRVYIAGDTENIPEMQNLRDIDIAFLPMNLPYTMTPEMVAEAARMFRPGILYPYHTGDTDMARLPELLKDEKDIEVRLRDMK